MKVFAYYRSATSLQIGDLSIKSFKDQKLVVDAFAKNLNLEIVKEFYDMGMSGSDTDRKSYTNMIDALHSVDGIIVYDLDRLNRNLKHNIDLFYYCAQNKKKIYLAKDKRMIDNSTGDERFYCIQCNAQLRSNVNVDYCGIGVRCWDCNKYNNRLVWTVKVLEGLWDLIKHEGGSFRHFIYNHLGFKPDSYVKLYEGKGMEITNWISQMIDNVSEMGVKISYLSTENQDFSEKLKVFYQRDIPNCWHCEFFHGRSTTAKIYCELPNHKVNKDSDFEKVAKKCNDFGWSDLIKSIDEHGEIEK